MEIPSSPVKEITVKISKTTLPEEIVTDIISRLPVKRVFQAQCLSKNFSSITSDPYFVESHLKHSSRLRPAIILNGWTFVDLIRCSSGNVLKSTLEAVPLHRDIQFSTAFHKVTIVGSCNGLVVLAVGNNTNHCFLWNPAINQYNRLPAPSSVLNMKFASVSWGIGYCKESSVYKIVRLAFGHVFRDDYLPESINFAEVFSCGTDRSWRRLDFSKVIKASFLNGTTIKGIVYWETTESGLLAFDLAKEKFSWVPLPLPMYGTIMEFKGSLAICCLPEIDKKSYDLWVMRGGKSFAFDSLCHVADKCFWEKIYTTVEFKFSLNTYPARILNDRQLLLLSNGINYDDSGVPEDFTCALYDLESKVFKQIPSLTHGLDVVHNFVESLVPLYSFDYSSSDHDIDDSDEYINNEYDAIDYDGNVAEQE